MSTEAPSPPDSLEAKSPFELRVNQSSGVQESFVKKSLETGDVGFLHSFTTGSAVDGPGIRVVAWTAGCQWRCRYCHNPDTWSMTNGMAVPLERAVDELRKYRRGLQVMSGGFTLSGGEPLMQDRFAVRLLHGGQGDGGSHRDRDQRLPGRPPQRRGVGPDRPGAPGHQVLGRSGIRTSPARTSARRSTSPAAWRPGSGRSGCASSWCRA